MLRKLTSSLSALGCLIAFSAPAHAAITFDDDVTPDVIFGSGNANGSFTVDRTGGVELGLRAKLRHNSSGASENTFNSNGDGSYDFEFGVAPTQSFPTGVWSFEWSVNSNYDGSQFGYNLDDLTYDLSLTGPSGTPVTFDPINGGNPGAGGSVFWDHAIGDNSTANGDGISAANEAAYADLIANNNVAQNSWKAVWFFPGFDPTVTGTYTISLAAFDGGQQVAFSTIDINVVPEPASLLVWSLLGTVGIAAGYRRRRRTA